MTQKSKYCPFFTFIDQNGKISASCKLCDDYQTVLKSAAASKSGLKLHLKKHPEQYKIFESSDKKKEEEKTESTFQLSSQQESLKRLFSNSNSVTPSEFEATSSKSIRIDASQPKIDKVLSN